MHRKALDSLLLLLEGPTLQGVLGGCPQLVMAGRACQGGLVFPTGPWRLPEGCDNLGTSGLSQRPC